MDAPINIIECSVCKGTGRLLSENSDTACTNCAGQGIIGTDGQVEYLMQIDETSGKATIIGIKPPSNYKGNQNSPYKPNKFIVPIFLFVMTFSFGLISVIIYILGLKPLGIALGIFSFILFAIFIISLVLRIPGILNLFSEPRDFIWVVEQKKSMKH